MSDQDETPEVEESDEPTFVVSNKVYDLLRFVAVIVLPGLGTAYFGLAGLLGLPAAEQVVGTITITDTFLGFVVSRLRSSYKKSDARFDGAITVEPNHEEGTTDLNVSIDRQAVIDKDEVLVKIKKPSGL